MTLELTVWPSDHWLLATEADQLRWFAWDLGCSVLKPGKSQAARDKLISFSELLLYSEPLYVQDSLPPETWMGKERGPGLFMITVDLDCILSLVKVGF